MTNPLLQLADAGQAVWLDYLHRKILDNGDLERLIREDGLKGLTSNPSIFEKAIAEGQDYDSRLRKLLAAGDSEAGGLYEQLAIADLQDAADLFRPVYDRLGGGDGFVSLEVSPYLAMDTAGTIAEARRLWRAVDRPNLMIKVPGTAAGVPAIRALIGEGINVNVTLLFGLDAYLAVADAHMAGLETLRAAGGDLSKVHGVASFFVSRIDAQIDKAIDAKLETAWPQDAEILRTLRGKVAIANAKVAYRRYLDLVASSRWQALAGAGAVPQRLLWASTGTKDPAYSDVLYVETLIGPDTINTMPPKTVDAFRGHGTVRPTLTEDVDSARTVLAQAERLGLDLNGVTGKLVEDGVRLFAQAFDDLLAAVAGKRAQILADRLDRQSLVLPPKLGEAVKATLARASSEGWPRRIWAKDGSLWPAADAGRWLGWLAAGEGRTVDLAALEAFQEVVKRRGFSHALLLGMGGSSLGPEVLAETFGARPGHPQLLVLDSTDPGQIARVQATIDPAATLFIVSSKSGTTLEPEILRSHFFALASGALGGPAGASFVAVTDPGSELESIARRDGFLQVFHGDPAIGGRYSVLSNFGMVPAAAMGLDVRVLFETAGYMVRACGPNTPPIANPGVHLGVVMGEAARAGRNKITFIASDQIRALGAWMEQLIAESTGKSGKGLVPIDGEPPGAPKVYGDDRLFVYLRLDGEDGAEHDAAVRELHEAGHPVVRITLPRPDHVVQEFFRWEMATAVAGAVIGIDPFDQPDVEASKIKTRALTDRYEADGQPPAATPVLENGGAALYADPATAKALAADGASTLEAALASFLSTVRAGGYVALMAYVDRNAAHHDKLQRARARIRDRFKAATALEYGPRFLHSTGQAYKGGPDGGLFLQLTFEQAKDIPIPGRKYSFGIVEAAQALGDFEVLVERGRRILRIHLTGGPEAGLQRFVDAVDRALA
jgi:transaldolase/glucose-6-phosphate isomerase